MPQTPPARSRKRASQSQSLPARSEAEGTPLLRQWNLIQRLSLDREGSTVVALANAFGVDLKTIRRDLILLRKVGFKLESTADVVGRKYWRIRQPDEVRLPRRKQYRAIRDSLDRLVDQAEQLEDARLVKSLKIVRRAAAERCG